MLSWKKYYQCEDFENNVKISSRPALSCKIRIIFTLLWVLKMRTKYVFSPVMHNAEFTILNVAQWIRMSVTVCKVNIPQNRKYLHDGKRKGRRAFIFVFVMNLNHSCTDAFCYLKNKTFGNSWLIQVDEISNENALKWLYVALIVSRIIATSRSHSDIVKITVWKSCRACHGVLMMWIYGGKRILRQIWSLSKT